MSLPVGSRLGPYEVLAPLGAGGMGEVYRAKDPRLGREVAVKVLPASLSNDPDRLRRFEQEARAAGLLNHPNITAVYDIGSLSPGDRDGRQGARAGADAVGCVGRGKRRSGHSAPGREVLGLRILPNPLRPPRRRRAEVTRQARERAGARGTTTYTSYMPSVAEELRRELREEVRRMTVSERLTLALRLGDDDLELFSRARNIDRESGTALLRRGRQNGRRLSRCFDAAR